MTVALTTASPPSPQCPSITEQDDFLALFPHRYDYLWAAHPDPDERPDWKTESKHPLSDRHIQQGSQLYGVRFGKLTRYLVLDIDRHSLYHPIRDPFAIGRMVAALEAIGLIAYVAVTSSYSGGLHLYFPFEQAQPSWAIALVVSTLLEQAGFKLKPGQLEVFPNPRPYTNGTPSLYTGHRVPMQAGSYLLNQHWEQVYSNQAAFVRRWRWAEQRNDLNHKTIKRVLKQAQRQRYKNVTVSAQKFLNDLQTGVECGWTGTGQTNQLLGQIAKREYIFGHVLRGGTPLTGQALVDTIITVAVALPGYTEYCRHQHEIHKLARDWARSIEANPKYYPYDPSKRAKPKPQLESQPQNNIVSFQQALALDAAQRIKTAIARLQATDAFPTGATARADAIIAIARCSNQTLHKHKALWHPDHTASRVGARTEAVAAIDGNPAGLPPETLEPLPEGSLHDFTPNKFMLHPAALLGQAERLQASGGSGGLSTADAEAFATGLADTSSPSLPPASQGMTGVDGAVVSAATTIAQAQQQQQQRQRQAATLARMTQWIESSDPILMAEAAQWFAARESDPGSLIQEVTTNSQKQPHSDFVAGSQPPQPQPPTPKPERLSTGQRADHSPSPQTAGEAATRDGYDAVFDQIASHRIQLNKPVRQTVLANPLERVQLALAAVLEYLQRLEAKGDRPKQTKEAILVKALKDGWTPKGQTGVTTSAGRTAPSGFQEWYKLAHSVGLVSAAQMQAGVQLVLTSRGDWEPWEAFVVAFPLAELQEMAQAGRS